MVPISNRPFRSLLEYLEEMLAEVLRIVVLCRGQVSRRTTDGRTISCWCVYQCPLSCRSSGSVPSHGPSLRIDTDSFAVLTTFALWRHGEIVKQFKRISSWMLRSSSPMIFSWACLDFNSSLTTCFCKSEDFFHFGNLVSSTFAKVGIRLKFWQRRTNSIAPSHFVRRILHFSSRLKRCSSLSRFKIRKIIGFVTNLTIAVFSRERFTTVTAYRGFVTKSQLLETLFTRN